MRTVTSRTPLDEAVALAEGAARDQPAVPVVLPGRSPEFATAVSEVLALLGPADLRAAADRGDAALPAGAPPVAVGTGETPAEALARVDAAGAGTAVLLRDGRLAGLVTRDRLAALAAEAAEH